MKTFILKSLLFISLLSCANVNEKTEKTTRDKQSTNANIRFTIEEETYEFNLRVIASPIKSNGNTSISIAESLPDAASLSLNFIFEGQKTGTYQIISGFDPSRTQEAALGFRFAQPKKRLSYDLVAQQIEVQITTYDVPAKGRPTVEGTFSGTLINTDTQETYEIKDGFFSTKM